MPEESKNAPFYQKHGFHLMDDGQWDGKFSIIPFYLSACTKVHIQGYPLQGFRWFDIGKPETLAQAEEYYKQK